MVNGANNDVALLDRLGGSEVWSALASDLGSPFAVIDRRGGIHFLNRVAQAVMHKPDAPAASIRDILGESMADERCEFAELALSSRRPISFLGMVQGSLYFVTYRPAGGDSDLILASAIHGSLVAERAELRPQGELHRARRNDFGRLTALTERELELLYHIGLARTSEESAGLMHRSTRTVEWHRASLGTKLGCDNRVQLARIANAAGITAIDSAVLIEMFRVARRARPDPIAS